jgi:hypothetical protein
MSWLYVLGPLFFLQVAEESPFLDKVGCVQVAAGVAMPVDA